MLHHVAWQTAASCLRHGRSGPIREVTWNMSNKSVGVALGRAVYNNKKKEGGGKYETEKERNGSKKDSKKRKEE